MPQYVLGHLETMRRIDDSIAAVGIGLFLLLLGMHQTGIVTNGPSPDVPLKLGDLRDARVLLAVGGFVLIAVLLYWRGRGGILLGVVLSNVANSDGAASVSALASGATRACTSLA